MANDKLKRLREWIRSYVSYPLPNSPAGQLSIENILLKIDRLLAEENDRPPAGPSDAEIEAFASRIALRVSELPDRSSPEDWPEAMLVTGDELAGIIKEEFEEFGTLSCAAAAPQPAPGFVVIDEHHEMTPEKWAAAQPILERIKARKAAAKPATANEVAVRELERFLAWYHDFRPSGYPCAISIKDYIDQRLAALGQPAPAKEETK